jgi:hypothetical protein
MMLLKPKVGGSTGKGPGEIVACGASWHVVFDDGLMQLAARRATRPESFVLTPPRGEPLRRPPSRPTPAHPTQAWAMEGAGSAETADPTGAARVATLHGPHPPRPPVRRFRSPLETGSRPPGPPPSTAHPRRFPHRPTAPATRSIYSLVWEEKTRRPRLRQTQAVYCPPNRGRSRPLTSITSAYCSNSARGLVRRGAEPPHIHVQQESRTAKFWLNPVALAASGGFSAVELRTPAGLVTCRILDILAGGTPVGTEVGVSAASWTLFSPAMGRSTKPGLCLQSC